MYKLLRHPFIIGDSPVRNELMWNAQPKEAVTQEEEKNSKTKNLLENNNKANVNVVNNNIDSKRILEKRLNINSKSNTSVNTANTKNTNVSKDASMNNAVMGVIQKDDAKETNGLLSQEKVLKTFNRQNSDKKQNLTINNVFQNQVLIKLIDKNNQEKSKIFKEDEDNEEKNKRLTIANLRNDEKFKDKNITLEKNSHKEENNYLNGVNSSSSKDINIEININIDIDKDKKKEYTTPVTPKNKDTRYITNNSIINNQQIQTVVEDEEEFNSKEKSETIQKKIILKIPRKNKGMSDYLQNLKK